jgi:tRNA A37 methylthiotransferase MiaB
LFEYHDEALATSSKLPWKISDRVIRERFLELDEIVDKKITAKEKAKKGKSFTGYVMNIKSSWLGTRHSSLLVVRPQLHAPEMDPYDTISIDQITKIYNDTWIISIGDKITYKL